MCLNLKLNMTEGPKKRRKARPDKKLAVCRWRRILLHYGTAVIFEIFSGAFRVLGGILRHGRGALILDGESNHCLSLSTSSE